MGRGTRVSESEVLAGAIRECHGYTVPWSNLFFLGVVLKELPESMWDLRCVGSSEGFQHSSCGRAISGDTASRNQNLSTEK